MAETGFITNQVVIKKGEEVRKLEQVVTFNSYVSETGDTNLFTFSGTFMKKNNTTDEVEVENRPLLVVEKRYDNSYGVRIKQGQVYKSASEKTLEEIGLTKDGDDFILNIDPSSPAVSMKNKGEELIVEVNSTDGKKYKITAGATQIDIEYGEDKFSYATEDDTTISTDIDTSVISEFLDKKNVVCQTPEKLSDFPNYLIGLFASSIENNSTSEFGDYKITKIDASANGNAPYLFVTKTNSNLTQTNYLFINGKFQKCDNFLCQYEKAEDGTINPSIVLEVSPLRRTKSSTMKYYSIPLAKDGDKLSETSLNVLSRMSAISSDISNGQNLVSIGNDANKYNFYIKDSREYAKDYNFVIKPMKFVKEEEKDQSDPGPQPPRKPEKEVDPAPEPEPDEQKNKDDEDKPQERKLDISKPVETLSSISGYVGLFLFAAAALTPAGAILAPLGLSLGLGGAFGSAIAGDLKWKWFKKAKSKVKQYEELEDQKKKGKITEQEYEQKLAKLMASANEKEKDKIDLKIFENNRLETYKANGIIRETFSQTENQFAELVEKSNENDAILSAMLEDSASPLFALNEAYNEYGNGFTAELGLADGDDNWTRTEMLCGYDGLEIRENMLSHIEKIQNASKPNTKNQLINSFVNQYFLPMPKADEEKVKAIFKTQNQPLVRNFTKALEEKNKIDKDVKAKRDEQINMILNLKDSSIENLVSAEKMDSVQRERFFKNYSSALVRRFALDKSFNEAKLSRLIASVPSGERAKITKILKTSVDSIDAKLAYARILALTNKNAVQSINGAEIYVEALKDLKEKPEKYSSLNSLSNSTDKFLQAYDVEYYNRKGNMKKAENLKSTASETKNLNAEGKEVASMMNSTINKVNKGSTAISNAWTAIYNKLKEKDANGNCILDDVARTYGQGKYSSLYPNTLVTTFDFKKTIVEIARKQNNPDLTALVINYDTKSVQASERLTKEIPNMLSTVEAELATYGITVEENAVNKEAKSLSASFLGNSDNHARMAKIKAQIDQKLKELEKEDKPENKQQIQHLIKVDKFMDEIASGTLINAQNDASVVSAIKEISPNLTYSKGMAQEAAESVRKDVAGMKNTEKIIDKIDDTIHKNSINAKFKEKTENGIDASVALQEALKETLGDKQHNLNAPTYQQLIDKHTKNGEIDYAGIITEIHDMNVAVNKESQIELMSMKDDLGEELGHAEYEDKQKNPNQNDNFYIAYSTEAKDEAEKLRKASEKFVRLNSQLKSAWDKAINQGNVEKLKTIVSTPSMKSMFIELGLNAEEIDYIIELSSNDPQLIKQNLLDYDKEQNLIKKADKEEKELKVMASRSAMLATLPSEEAREFAQSQFDLAELDAKILEINAKFDAITNLDKEGYDPSTVKDSLVAFVNGDEQYFASHPEIKIAPPYFFSKQDVELLSTMKIKGKKLLKKDIKLISSIVSLQLSAQRDVAVKKIEKLKEENENNSVKKKFGDNKILNAIKSRLHLTSSALEGIDKELENAPRSSTPQERLANVGLIYDDTRTL